MYQKDIQKKFDIIAAKFSIDQQYARKFFSDIEFAKRELAHIRLQMNPQIYHQLEYSYKKLNNVSMKSETFENHWNALTYIDNHNKLITYSKRSMKVGVTTAIRDRFSKLHLKFRGRASAASMLASMLKSTIKNDRGNNKEDFIVLGILRGGIVIADIVARKLSADFDVVVVRKLGDPQNREHAIGAVALDKNGNITKYINQKHVDELNILEDYLEGESSAQIEEVKHRSYLYCDRERENQITRDKTVILVDDGIATGSTIISAARSIRKQEPKRLIIAAPVAPRETAVLLRQEADAVEIITTPSSSHFNSIGQFYQNFETVMDEKVFAIIRNRSLSQ